MAVGALLVSAPGCGDDPRVGLGGGSNGSPDAGAPDGGPPVSDGGSAGGDAGTDAPPGDGNPFSSDPLGGEFAWVATVPGVDSSSSVVAAVDASGNIFVAATQNGAVAFGSVQLPAPTAGEPLLVLGLTARGEPIWGRTLGTTGQSVPRALAVTPAGDVVIGATVDFPGTGFGTADAFVVLLDGHDGTTRWTSPWTSPSDDAVTGVAAGLDRTGTPAIYVFGGLGTAGTVAGQALPIGGVLARYNEDGTLRWVQSIAGVTTGFSRSLALDPERGPVITGDGTPTIAGQPLTSGGAFVAGFDPDGGVRFANQILAVETALNHNVAIAADGGAYVAGDTERDDVVIDGHLLPAPRGPRVPFVARFTANGRFATSHEIVGEFDADPMDIATDASGALYLATTCRGLVEVQPEITCASGNGGIIASYGADDRYRWATSIDPAFIGALAPAPGNRMIVAGTALAASTSFGGVPVATRSLFIAALAGGPPRAPSPLPLAPAITSAVLDGTSDGAIRQGGTGTLVIEGGGLDRVTTARLDDIEIHVPPGSTAGVMRLPITIPHGHAPGPLALTLGNAAGSAQLAGVVTVTPIVLAADGSDSGLGTFSSPLRLCLTGASWVDRTRYGDLMLLRNGVHACSQGATVGSGVTLRGESKDGATVTGDTGGPFGGFAVAGDGLAPAAIENLTIQSAPTVFAAITVLDFNGPLAVNVTDVDMLGLAGSGIYVATGGTAVVTRYRYQQSSGTALAVFGGRVDAHQVDASGAFRGALVIDGTLTLDDSVLSSSEAALQAGDPDELAGTRTVRVTRTTLSSSNPAVVAFATDLTIDGSTLVPHDLTTARDAIDLQGGTLTMTDTTVQGWPGGAIVASPLFGSSAPLNLSLDRITVSACGAGIDYDADQFEGNLVLHDAVIQTQSSAVAVRGGAAVSFATFDLGTAATPGNNRLTTESGPALLDARTAAALALDAHGTVLNGVTYTGDVLGPADVATGYHIETANTIHF